MDESSNPVHGRGIAAAGDQACCLYMLEPRTKREAEAFVCWCCALLSKCYVVISEEKYPISFLGRDLGAELARTTALHKEHSGANPNECILFPSYIYTLDRAKSLTHLALAPCCLVQGCALLLPRSS